MPTASAGGSMPRPYGETSWEKRRGRRPRRPARPGGAGNPKNCVFRRAIIDRPYAEFVDFPGKSSRRAGGMPPPTSLRNCQRRNGATSRNNHVIARPAGPHPRVASLAPTGQFTFWQSRGQWFRGKSTGLPRRFAPRNDGGGRRLVLLFCVGGHHGIFRCHSASVGRPGGRPLRSLSYNFRKS